MTKYIETIADNPSTFWPVLGLLLGLAVVLSL